MKTPALASLKAGQKGRIASIGLESRNRRRLLEMGLIAGREFTLVRFAPLGDPMELKIGGSHLSLRKDEARHILVEVL
ncbi:MAG: ferrous iron transport protein A [Methylacidiphilales bacterium]|nr:ferrous iron transport protein A [Candidatus Methylacidiphilales bacterium]